MPSSLGGDPIHAMGCLSDDTLCRYLDQGLSEEHRADVERHLADCDACRSLLSETFRGLSQPAHGDASDAPFVGLRRGDSIGRFLLLDHAGSGAMGLVYAAYDTQLDRKVALKLLRAPVGERGELKSSLLSEAKAMARLSHPHVVQIYEVGSFREDRVFLAMELVEGETLASWREKGSRGWAEVVELYVQAGRGLEAAHAAGLAHGDFKPENVLVGADGRARVTDFGLSRLASRSPADDSLLSGTPAYMAPAQLEGAPADALSDQFSFCVSFCESLAGQRPPRSAGAPPSVPADAPRWLRQLLARGLAPRAEDRHPSMGALLAAIERGRASTRRRAALLALFAVALGAAGLVWFSNRPAIEQTPCAGSERHLAGVWDGARREQLKAAFLATKLPYAEDTFTRFSAALDRYSGDWVDAHRAACEATQVHKDQPPEMMALRMACLEQVRKELNALTSLWAQPDPSLVQKAPNAVSALTPLSRCANAVALSSVTPLPRDEPLRSEVLRLQQLMYSGRSLKTAGRYAEGAAALKGAIESAEATGYAPVLAELQQEACEIEDFLGAVKNAERLCLAAAASADKGRNDAVRTRALAYLVYIVGYQQNRPTEGRAFAQLATAANARLGPDVWLDGLIHSHLGVVEGLAGDYESAFEHSKTALEKIEAVLGPEHSSTATAAENVGIAHLDLGQLDLALAFSRRAADSMIRAIGPSHPYVGRSRQNLGEAYFALGQYTAALAEFERALEIRTAVLGRQSPKLVRTWQDLGDALAALGRSGEAREAFAQALANARAAKSSTAQVALGFAELELLSGRPEVAFRRASEAWREARAEQGEGHPALADFELALAAAAQARGSHARAREHGLKALGLLEQKLGSVHPRLAPALGAVAEANLSLGQTVVARAALERAYALQKPGTAAPWRRAWTAYALARALTPDERIKGTGLAREAQKLLETAEGVRAERLRAQVQTFLAKHHSL